MAKGRRRQKHEVPGSKQPSGTETAAAAVTARSCSRLLKRLCPGANFSNELFQFFYFSSEQSQPAHSEHQIWIGCLGGIRDLQGDTEFLEWGPEVRISPRQKCQWYTLFPSWALPHPSVLTQQRHSGIIIKLDYRGSST